MTELDHELQPGKDLAAALLALIGQPTNETQRTSMTLLSLRKHSELTELKLRNFSDPYICAMEKILAVYLCSDNLAFHAAEAADYICKWQDLNNKRVLSRTIQVTLDKIKAEAKKKKKNG